MIILLLAACAHSPTDGKQNHAISSTVRDTSLEGEVVTAVVERLETKAHEDFLEDRSVLASDVVALAVISPEPLHSLLENDTHLRTQTFVVELPGMWKQLPSNEAFAFVRGVDTVFISRLDTQTKLQWGGGKATAAWLADIRRKALDEAAQGKITFTPRRGTLKDGREMYYFSGLDLLNKKRFYVAVVGLPEVLVSVTLYRSMDEPSAGFEELLTGIMWSVRSPAG